MPCGCGPQFTEDDMDYELPSEADMARFGHDAEVTTTCQECGREIYDDCEICPNCAAFQTHTPDNQTCAAVSSTTNSIGKALFPAAAILLVVAFLLIFIL